jgi:hypothetical protein
MTREQRGLNQENNKVTSNSDDSYSHKVCLKYIRNFKAIVECFFYESVAEEVLYAVQYIDI